MPRGLGGWLGCELAQSSRSEAVLLPWFGTLIQTVNRHPISVRPTAAQLAWLKAQRTTRGLTINALVVLALEAAMKAAPAPSGLANDKA